MVSQEWNKEHTATWDTNPSPDPRCSFNNSWFTAFLKWIPPPSSVINLVLAVQSDQVQMIAGIFGFTAWFSTEIKMSQSNSWPTGTLKLRLGSFHSGVCVFIDMQPDAYQGPCVCSFMLSPWTPCDRFRKINLKRQHDWTYVVNRSHSRFYRWCGVRSIMSSYVIGKPVMIVTEYMENGSLDTFLRVSKGSTHARWILMCQQRGHKHHSIQGCMQSKQMWKFDIFLHSVVDLL